MELNGTKKITPLELIILGAVIVVIGGASVWAVVSTQRTSRDLIRLASMKEIYYGLELYFDSQNDYPHVANLVLGGAAAQCLDDKGFHAQNDCNGHVFLSNIPANPTSGGTNFVYSYLEGPPSNYRVQFALEGVAGGLASGGHLMSGAGLQ